MSDAVWDRHAVVVMDSGGRIAEFDTGAERLFGYSRIEAVGVRLGELLVPERLRAAHEAGLRRFRETGTGPLLKNAFDLPAICHDGREIRIELTLSPAGTDRIRGVLREITEPLPIPGELFLAAEFHRTLVESAPGLIAVLDAAGDVRWSSPACAELTSAPTGGEALRRAAASGSVEVRLSTETDTTRSLALVARDLLTDPAVHGIVCYGTDITRARDAERRHRVEAARLTALIEALNVGVLLQDEQQRVVLANSTFVELFALGLAPERLRGAATRGGSAFAQWYADQDAAERRVAETVSHGRPAVGEEVVLGNGRVMQRDYQPITLDGTTLGHLWVFRDVTAQAEIRRGLEARNRILTELSSLKTEFVRVASHELRTPLTSIATFAAMLDDGSGAPSGLDSDDRDTAIAAIRRNADRMLVLVADLLLLAKLESGEITLRDEAVDVPALIASAREHAVHGPDPGSGGGLITFAHHPAVPVDLRVGDGRSVRGDPTLLEQLVDTAVGLVVAAADPDGTVTVTATSRETVIADGDRTGWTIGVSTATAEPASAERLLSTRLPHPDTFGELRTGALALMLAREIAARHGGELITAAGEHGVTVTVRLPHRPPA